MYILIMCGNYIEDESKLAYTIIIICIEMEMDKKYCGIPMYCVRVYLLHMILFNYNKN